MIGEWAMEYVIQDDAKDDEDFLIFRLTDLEFKFAEKICLTLMLVFITWCSIAQCITTSFVILMLTLRACSISLSR